MAQTVIGIFETRQAAEEAIRQLSSGGFAGERLNISLPEETRGRGDITDEKNTLYSKLGKYFSDIFGDNTLALKYAAVAQQGTVVSLQTERYDDAERAAAILDRCGALNVDERARILEDAMTREDRLKEKPGITRTSNSPAGWDTAASRPENQTDRTPQAEPRVSKSRIVERGAPANRVDYSRDITTESGLD